VLDSRRASDAALRHPAFQRRDLVDPAPPSPEGLIVAEDFRRMMKADSRPRNACPWNMPLR